MKNDINIADLTQEFVEELNEALGKRGIKKVFDVKIVKSTTPLKVSETVINEKKGGTISKSKPTRTIKLYVNDLETNERRVLFEKSYTPNNPSELMSRRYVTLLHARFLADCFTFTAINYDNLNMEAKAQLAIKQAAQNATQIKAEESAIKAEEPLTPADATSTPEPVNENVKPAPVTLEVQNSVIGHRSTL